MSLPREPLEFFRWFYDADPTDEAAVRERWHEDLTIVQDADFPGSAGTFHGYAGLDDVNRELSESYEDMIWQPERVLDLGDDRYLILVAASGRGRASGIELEVQIAHLVTVREGRASRIEAYLTWERALAEAGVTEPYDEVDD